MPKFDPEKIKDHPRLSAEQQREYVKNGGLKCPFCGSEDVAGDKLEVDGPLGFGLAWCNDCHEEWGDFYKLIGINLSS